MLFSKCFLSFKTLQVSNMDQEEQLSMEGVVHCVDKEETWEIEEYNKEEVVVKGTSDQTC